MPFPASLNRKNDKLLLLMRKVEEFDYSEGKTLKLQFKSHSKAVYRRGQLYAAWRNIRKEFSLSNQVYPETPKISIKDAVLIFSQKEGKDNEPEFVIIGEKEGEKHDKNNNDDDDVTWNVN